MAKGFGNLLKQAQKMQERLAKVQEEVALREVEATAGGGMVTVKVNGRQQVVEVKIEKDVVNPDDLEMLQDLIVAAVNEGIKKSQEMVAEAMGEVTGGLGAGLKIPGLG